MEDYLDIDLSKYDIGKEYCRNNKKCIFDPIREILSLETPEEIIRQKFIMYLIDNLKVPKNKIGVEVPMCHFQKGAKGRADIVVYGEDDNTIFIVECKAPNIPLIDEVWNQVEKYDDILCTGLIVITNGNYTYAALWNDEDQSYYIIENMPEYNMLLDDENFDIIENDCKEWKRPKFNELTSKENIELFLDLEWIGEDTEEDLYPLIMNLAGFLHDETIEIEPINKRGINIIENGHRYTSFGNAAGVKWTGDYRYFILEDSGGNNQIVSISIFGSFKCTNDPVFGNRKGKTVLIVAIDDFDTSHNSLQLNIDKYTIVNGNKYTIWHDGTLTVGKGGAVKRKDVVDYIKSVDSSMVNNDDKIILGSFDCSKEINWNQKNTRDFIINIIKYAILRDEFRMLKKSSLQYK